MSEHKVSPKAFGVLLDCCRNSTFFSPSFEYWNDPMKISKLKNCLTWMLSWCIVADLHAGLQYISDSPNLVITNETHFSISINFKLKLIRSNRSLTYLRHSEACIEKEQSSNSPLIELMSDLVKMPCANQSVHCCFNSEYSMNTLDNCKFFWTQTFTRSLPSFM